MRIGKVLLGTVGTAAVVTSLSPVMASAATYSMKPMKIELNGHVLSAPSGFVSQKTTYMPLFYVQQLLNQLNITNHWSGTIWTIKTPFPNQPTFTLSTTVGNMGIVVNNEPFAAHVTKIVTIDPSSKQDTTFIPIWYIQKTLDSLGLVSTWTGSVWNVTTAYTDVSKTGTSLGSFTNLSDAKTALLDFPGGVIKDKSGQVVYTEPSFENVDLRYAAPANINMTSLNQYLASHSTIMAGLGQAFMDAQSRYGVDANYLVSHAIEETGSNGEGTGSNGSFSTIAQTKNNLFGYGAFDANANAYAGTFPSMDYAILYQAWEIRNNYLNPSSSHYSSPTLTGISSVYASDANWANKVNDLMDQLAIDVKDNVTSYVQYTPANRPVPPAGSANIPVYLINGATGTVEQDANYGNAVPVYTDGGTGHQYMFVRPLQLNDTGQDVETLQLALNAADNAGLKTDGVFGPNTQTALLNYQSMHGLQPTGVCDFNLWNNVLNLSHATATVSAGQGIQIDQIVEGMAGPNVTEWYHIPNVGWVNAADVTLNNVYRVTVPSLQSASDVNVTVSDASGTTLGTLHAGDYVVSQNSQPTNGKILITYTAQDTGATVSGYIDASKATLTQVSN